MRGPWGAEPFRVLFDGNPCPPRLHFLTQREARQLGSKIQRLLAKPTAAAGESRGTGGQRICAGKSDRFWDSCAMMTQLFSFSAGRSVLYLVFNQSGYSIWFSIKALFSSPRNSKIFEDSLSHRILRHMHEILNIDENKN